MRCSECWHRQGEETYCGSCGFQMLCLGCKSLYHEGDKYCRECGRERKRKIPQKRVQASQP